MLKGNKKYVNYKQHNRYSGFGELGNNCFKLNSGQPPTTVDYF